MAARTLAVTTPLITGASVASISTVMASSDTCVISVSTAQSLMDMATLVVRAVNANTITSVVLSLAATTEFSDAGVGAASITVGTAETMIIGGQFFESARFLSSGGTITFTATGTGPTSLEAYQKPKASE